nr:MAG TPA: hypothetical protein [Caudoviricetes sp.]
MRMENYERNVSHKFSPTFGAGLSHIEGGA